MCVRLLESYLYTVAPGKVGGIIKNFFQVGQPPQKHSKTMRSYMNNIP